MTDEAYFDRLVDVDALGSYLAEHLGAADAYEVRRHEAGHSNETLFVTWGERELVLRRPPPGATAETAHDVLREYRVVDALQETPVPVPPTVIACADADVIGSDFYLMDRVAGEVLRLEEPDAFSVPVRREAVGRKLVDTLAAIHTIDPEEVGLEEFGYPSGFAERQVRRWSEQLTWAFAVTADERAVSELYDVTEWLVENAPDEHPHTLVHGDYKLDNVMYAPVADATTEKEPVSSDSQTQADDGASVELAAVFDWELSTLGDPRTDLGWMLSYWRDPGDPEPAVPELTATFMERDGYHSRRDLVDRYEAQTGIAFENERFYRTLAVYKLAALGEMFFRRYLEGNSDDPIYPTMETRVPALAERATRIIEGEEPL